MDILKRISQWFRKPHERGGRRSVVTRVSLYRVIELCIGCDKELTMEQKMYSRGCCPHCGNISVGTTCKTKKKTIKG